MYESSELDWFGRTARTAVLKDEMKLSERTGEVAGIVVTVLTVFFFVAHQVWNTGFFTAGFGPFETVLFYASISFGIVTGTARAVLGKRNKIRPLDVSGYILAALFCFWFFTVFPFDFTRFGDVVPLLLGFLISWIPGLLVKVLLFIGGVGAVAGAVYVTALYFRVRSLIMNKSMYRERKLMRTPFHH